MWGNNKHTSTTMWESQLVTVPLQKQVVEIGMRSTKILSVEKRMVVIPNSQIGKNEIIYYSYPDPSYLDIVNILVGYDNDVDEDKELITEAILSIDEVQKDREIYNLLIEFTETHMVFWAGWWIENYKDRYPVHDRASSVIMQKLKDASVVMPSRRGRLEVGMNPTILAAGMRENRDSNQKGVKPNNFPVNSPSSNLIRYSKYRYFGIFWGIGYCNCLSITGITSVRSICQNILSQF